jgi:hypothetical protein
MPICGYKQNKKSHPSSPKYKKPACYLFSDFETPWGLSLGLVCPHKHRPDRAAGLRLLTRCGPAPGQRRNNFIGCIETRGTIKFEPKFTCSRFLENQRLFSIINLAEKIIRIKKQSDYFFRVFYK